MASNHSITETLPTEILEIIIENLSAPMYQYDNNTRDVYTDMAVLKDLKACSLTCWNFVPLCQKHIFKTVDFPPSDTTDRTNNFDLKRSIARFAKIVEASPPIATYVNTITLWIASGPYFEGEDFPDKVLSGLRSLTNLRTIELHGWPRILYWNHIPPSLAFEIYHLLQLPTITATCITGIQNFDVHGIARCVALETLYLRHISIGDRISEYPSTLSPNKPIRLAHLNIVGCNQMVLQKLMESSKPSDAQHVFDFEHLRRFAIDFDSRSTKQLSEASDFLQVDMPFLETIEFTCKDWILNSQFKRY